MVRKSVPAKKASTGTKSTTSKTGDSQETSITTIKQSTCNNLQGTATLTYHIGRDVKGELHWKIHSNSGAGMFSSAWVSFNDIQQVLDKWPKDSPITSLALRSLYQNKSVNTPSFLLATLVNEGILHPVPDKKRHYQLGNTQTFLAGLEELTADSKSGSKVKAKAGARMPKGKAKPASGE